MTKFDIELLKMIICPKTGSELTFDEKKNVLISKDKKNIYPIKDGMPILLIDD